MMHLILLMLKLIKLSRRRLNIWSTFSTKINGSFWKQTKNRSKNQNDLKNRSKSQNDLKNRSKSQNDLKKLWSVKWSYWLFDPFLRSYSRKWRDQIANMTSRSFSYLYIFRYRIFSVNWSLIDYWRLQTLAL